MYMQVLLRWSLQRGLVPIPRSSNPGRITENAKLFDFHVDTDAMLALEQLDERYASSCSGAMFGQLDPLGTCWWAHTPSPR